MEKITDHNVKAAVELDQKHDNSMSRTDKLAVKFTNFAGSMLFLILHIVFFIFWMGSNLTFLHFDKYPFELLLMVISIESIFLTVFILIGQNISGDKQDRRHKLDLQINLLAEQENTAMLRVIDKIAKKVGVDSSELQPYLEDTQPGEVLQALELEEKEKGCKP